MKLFFVPIRLQAQLLALSVDSVAPASEASTSHVCLRFPLPLALCHTTCGYASRLRRCTEEVLLTHTSSIRRLVYDFLTIAMAALCKTVRPPSEASTMRHAQMNQTLCCSQCSRSWLLLSIPGMVAMHQSAQLRIRTQLWPPELEGCGGPRTTVAGRNPPTWPGLVACCSRCPPRPAVPAVSQLQEHSDLR